MDVNYLEKLYQHNNWANLQIIEACLALTDEQLDARPDSTTIGSIRDALEHFVTSQQGYLRTLTMPLEERLEPVPDPPLNEMYEAARRSGEGFIALVRDLSKVRPAPLETRDGYYVEAWVLIVQAINHATEHREQIKSMLTALGVTPPNIDGWDYGEVTHALIPKSS